ncbi:DUF1304 domain-containing protein [Klebsiella pneumoniae subsp. pneumoniae]|uniref:DUF1304 domain-containing protein n=1 Tax=Klebsiella pneumoniae TaxID=573 RepID=UPI0021B2C45D|nr:DUF1304 domain-containing protein [Klebsiella pneumoniae]MCT6795169.1 DUF1304 domain-containing protein [Klebsiella pneumoniae subsp. pneumoniae]
MLSNTLAAAVGLIHVYIVVLEMLLWDKPAGLRAFGMSREFALQSRRLAANQGLYNGFIVAGLVCGLTLSGDVGHAFKLFFLVCVVAAGIFGALTASRKILFVQALPAAIALAALLAGK